MPSSRPPQQSLIVVQAATFVARHLGGAARWLGPRLRIIGRFAGGRLAHAARGLGVGLWRGRGVVTGLLVRVLWCAALWLALQTTLDVLDTSQPIDVDAALRQFAIGVALCAAVTALAQVRRLRWAGIALGTTHGAALLLLHSLSTA